MNTKRDDAVDEAEVLRWLGRALELAAPQRTAWLAQQAMSAALMQRVARLLEAGDFLDNALPVAPLVEAFPRAGERVGAWQLVRELDAGGMGVVFLGRRADEVYEQQVAIKLIQPLHLSRSAKLREHFIQRFENERALLARLSHPNIARILDGGTTHSGVPYLVMEYIDGKSLIEYCDARRLDVRERLRIFGKVCEGVQDAHRNLIVHRDLKPGNVLVDKEGEPHLLDFGIARLLEDEPDRDGLTALTAMTPAYASPEQVQHKPLTTSSDVYSLGVMLYQLLAGVRPYDLRGLSAAQVERTICETAPAPLANALERSLLEADERARRRRALGEDLDRILAKAMHKDPQRRYASARELGEDLQRFLRGQAVLAHPDSRGYRLRKFIARHRLGTAAATLALAAVLVATALALRNAQRAQRNADDMAQVNAYLLDVLQLSDPFETGHELTLAQALDEAAKSIDTRFAGHPELSSAIRFGIGYSMLSRSRLDDAQTQLERALAESTAAFGSNDLRTLRIVEGLAGLRQEQGRKQEAERMFRDGIARMQAAGLEDTPLYLTMVNNLGNLYLTEERYTDAKPLFERAAELVETLHVEPAEAANVVSNLAQTAHGLGDFSRADRLYRQAQAQLTKAFPQGSPDLAILLNNRALLAQDRWQMVEALDLHKQSLAMRRKVLSGPHPMIVVALTNVARAALTVGDTAQALSAAEQAATMSDGVYTEPSSRHVDAWVALADARLRGGDLGGAGYALLRAEGLATALTTPTSGKRGYLDTVRDALCAKAPTQAPCTMKP